MKPPELRRVGDTLVWVFKESSIAIGFDFLRETSEGLLGEISVQGSVEIQPGKPPHYHWAKFNLSSTRARAELSRSLRDRNPDIEWADHLEYVCVHTADEWRRGEPVIDLSAGDEPEDDQYLIAGLLPAEETTVIFADGGSGKSYLALACGYAVRSGHGLPEGLHPTRCGNVLYLDWETNWRVVKRRTHWIARGFGDQTPSTLLYRPMYRPLADDIQSVRQEVARHAVDLVIVDSIGPACGGEPESADTILRLFNAMRSLSPATRLVVSHVSRAGAEQKQGPARPFGSAFVQNMARSVWELRKAESEDGASGSMTVALFHRKTNDDANHAPIGLQFMFDRRARAIRVAGLDVSEDSRLAAHASLSYRVRSVLKRGASTPKGLAELLDVTEAHVRVTLNRMPDAQRFTTGIKGEPGRWGLIAKGTDDNDLPF